MEMFNNSADDDWTGYEEMHGDCYRGISLQTRRLIYERDMQIRKSGNFFRFVLWDKLNLKSRHRTRFLGLREYQLTDDSNLIDWSASARLSAGNNWDKLFVRVPEVKQDFDIFVIFDASASMFFGTQNKLKSEYASMLAGLIINSATSVGKCAGIAFFNDSVSVCIPPRRGHAQYFKILEMLAKDDIYKGKCNLRCPLKYAVETLKPKTALFIISDFIGVDRNGKDWGDFLKSASSKFETVVGLMVRDARDSTLPLGVGMMRVRDPFTCNVLEVDVDDVREMYEQEARKQESHIRARFNECGAMFVKYYTTDNYAAPLVKYFDLRGA